MSGKATEKSCVEFAAALASREPVPGGGGAAALCGALAASLCAMAARLSAGRKRAAAQPERVQEIIQQADTLRERLLALVEEDAEGFAPLAAAYSLPKDTPGYGERMREATLHACAAPMRMAECCGETTLLLENMMELVSPLLLSDVGCGAALCRGTMESAAMNVLVNTKSLRGDSEAEQINARLRQRLESDLPRLEAIVRTVRGTLER